MLGFLFGKENRFYLVCGVFLVMAALWSAFSVLPALPVQAIEGEGIVFSRSDASDQQAVYIQMKDDDRLRFSSRLTAFPRVEEGDTIEIECAIKPAEPERYAKYLYSKGVIAICDKPKFNLSDQPLPKNLLIKSRLAVINQIAQLWPRPASSLVEGLLLGRRGSFSGQTLDAFSAAGITHIIAISGFNVTILIAFFEKLFISLFTPLRRRFGLILGFLFFFSIFVGASASLLRASLMGGAAYLGHSQGRQISIWRLMTLAAVLMVLFNPYILLYDLGFQLSFLATMGLMRLTDTVSSSLRLMPAFLGVKESLTTTLAASLLTYPLLLYQFGQISLIAPISNLLVLPLIPLVMLFSSLALLISLIMPFLVFPLVWVVSGMSYWILFISQTLAKVPLAVFIWQMPFWVFLTSTIALVFLFIYAKRH